MTDDRIPICRFGIECGAGWLPFIEKCFVAVQEAVDAGVQVKVFQIKQKLGALCFYVEDLPEERGSAAHDKMRQEIVVQENAASRCCEECGLEGQNIHASMFVRSYCPACLKALFPDRF